WWAIRHTVGLRSWPVCNNYRLIKDIFNGWKTWLIEEESQLLLTNFEMEKYMDETYGTDSRILKESDVACTILHSYGNAFRDCPCGCRALRFSER
ncbi:unnamed protein product, partial [Effrenium voratum]